jgi:hypothetical protein
MRRFEVYLNGKKLCLAGIRDDGVLTAIVDWVTKKGRGNLHLSVAGLVSPVSEHVTWVRQNLRICDEIVSKSSRRARPIGPLREIGQIRRTIWSTRRVTFARWRRSLAGRFRRRNPSDRFVGPSWVGSNANHLTIALSDPPQRHGLIDCHFYRVRLREMGSVLIPLYYSAAPRNR